MQLAMGMHEASWGAAVQVKAEASAHALGHLRGGVLVTQ